MIKTQMKINVYFQITGHHESAWRLPEAPIGATYDIGYWSELAKIAERGSLDSIFFGDSASLPLGDIRYRPGGRMDPVVLLSSLAAVTERIGLVATASTTFNEPFDIARRFASLDFISGGRAGWNIVTSGDLGSARNFGLEEPPSHEIRYSRAEEFVEVCRQLWDSWDDDFLIGDKERGLYADGDKIQAIDHDGDYFKVAGPLNTPRPPQGRPVLVQAGASPRGRAFAASCADAVFTAAQTIEEAREYYADVKRLVVEAGRIPHQVLVLPGIVPFIGDTREEAEALEARLAQWQVMDNGLKQLSSWLSTEVTIADLDRPLIEVVDVDDVLTVAGSQSRLKLIMNMAEREELSVRQSVYRLGAGRGHHVVAGTPEDIADHMEEWFRSGAADGFNLMPPVLPGMLSAFVDKVVPILQERRLFRRGYEGHTLRDHLGLSRPIAGQR